MFECGVLGGATGAILGFLLSARLPRLRGRKKFRLFARRSSELIVMFSSTLRLSASPSFWRSLVSIPMPFRMASPGVLITTR